MPKGVAQLMPPPILDLNLAPTMTGEKDGISIDISIHSSIWQRDTSADSSQNLYSTLQQEVDLGVQALKRESADMAVTLFQSALPKING